MYSLGLIELSEPTLFDPVGLVTTVFFDTKNQQVFSVRSGGATGIVVKSPGKQQKTFVLEDKGQILSIKLSPNQQVLSIQRKKSSLDLHNADETGQIDPTEYSLSPKNKNSPILGYFWSSADELVTVSDVGIDIYTIVSSKKLVKYMRSSSTSIAWFVHCPATNLIVTAAKQEASSLQVWCIKNSSIIKLAVLELTGSPVKEKDVSLINVYSRCFVRVNNIEDGAVSGIYLYSPENDQVILAHHLKFQSASTVGVQTLDNLILVHSLQDSSTSIYDLASSGEDKLDAASVTIHETILPTTSITEGSCVPLDYLPSWVVFLPNILVDARNGQMRTLSLRLKRAECDDPVVLCRLYLHRSGAKPHVLAHLKQSLQDTTVSLMQFSLMFHEIMVSYCQHQNTGELPTIQLLGSKNIQQQMRAVVVLDQSEVFTTVLAPAEKEGVNLVRLQGVLVELLLTLKNFKIKARQFIQEMFINLAVKTQQYYQMHQYIQYGVISDSKHIACIILSLESVYPPARQIALDMMSRLGNAVEELIEICLAEGKVVQAINLARESALSDTISARKYLEASRNLDPLTFFNVFSFFEERNVRLRGSARFTADEKCEPFVQQFKQTFLS